MIVLGIDCATSTGWALIDNNGGRERLIDHGSLDLAAKTLPSWQQIDALALRCGRPKNHLPEEDAPLSTPDVVAIELPWLGKNVATLIVLARLCGRFEQAFGKICADIRVIGAKEWQSKILGRFGGIKRDGLKKAAKIWAQAMFNTSLGDDESDAAGIATYVLRTTRKTA